MDQIRLLLVDDEAPARRLLSMGLQPLGFHIQEAGNGEEGLAVFQQGEKVDVVLTDLKMPGISGIEFVERAKRQDTSVQILVLTAFGAIETAVAAMRAGAIDYLTKPVEDIEHLARKLRAAGELRRTLRDNDRLRTTVTTTVTGSLLLGESAAIKKVRAEILRLAPSHLPILIHGPSGTGKELVARSLHLLSPRSDAPLVAVNVAAMPETLFEAELFGVEKGAFTGADKARKGLIRAAHGGTLFLDEIGELPLASQAKLLRVIEEKKVTPVGGNKEEAVDFRLVVATNRKLTEEVQAGRFREDLFYRLNAVTISIPPLKDRGEDVIFLAEHFLAELSNGQNSRCELSSEASRLLRTYPWPGNVRELRHAIERAVLQSSSPELSAGDFDHLITPQPSTALPTDQAHLLRSLAEIEAEHIRLVLGICQWNMTEAASYLGIHRNTLRQKIKEYHLDD